jgi:hypothetical protein
MHVLEADGPGHFRDISLSGPSQRFRRCLVVAHIDGAIAAAGNGGGLIRLMVGSFAQKFTL